MRMSEPMLTGCLDWRFRKLAVQMCREIVQQGDRGNPS